MTTEEFVEAVEALGIKTEENKHYGVRFIDIKNKCDEVIACIEVDVRGKMSVRKITNDYDHNTLFKIMCVYASTPVDERKSKIYKMKILGTDLYLIHINNYETTVTTNKKAAKAYNASDVYEAKVSAEKQGFALMAEVIDVDD